MAASSFVNMVRVLTATAGSGLTITLGAAVASYLGTGALTDGVLYSYIIEDQNGTGREVGQGTYHASGTTFDRTTVTASTNSGSRITLSGSAQIAFGVLAEDVTNKRGDTMGGALNWATAPTVTAATSTPIFAAASNYVLISGNTQINGFDTIAQGAFRWVRYTGTPVLHNNVTSFILNNNGNDIQVAAGDMGLAISDGSGNSRYFHFAIGGLPLLNANNLSDVGTKATAFNNVSPITSRGDIIVGGAAGVNQRLALGANNNIPVSNATDLLYSTLSAWFDNVLGSTPGLVPQRGASLWAGAAVGGALVPAADIRTASATITIPTGATKCKVTLVGGGGGGGGASGVAAGGCVCNPTPASGGAGGPGGPGGVVVKYLSGLTPGNTLALTIGSAGSGGAAGAHAGTDGGDSTLASGSQTITTLTASKGTGGGFGGLGTPGTPGTGTNGDLNISGGRGGTEINVTSAASISGSTGLGLGPSQAVGSGGSTAVNGVAGVGYGGAGVGGACPGTAATASGGNGTAGAAIFEWYI